MNIVITLTYTQPYAALPWGDDTGIAILFACIIFVIQLSSYFILIRVRRAMSSTSTVDV